MDDLPANVRLLISILELEGFTTSSASSGQDALRMVMEDRPDVVLLDAMMPGMHGFDVCRHIKADPATAFIPVVIVTALHEIEDRVQALEAGADDFLTKPVDAVEVLARVRSLVSAKRGREALENAYKRLQHAEAMRDTLSEMLVHDLRTPLTTMLVSLDMLQTMTNHELDEMQRELISTCARGSQQLLKMVNELLDIGKMQNGQMKLNREILRAERVIAEALEGFQVLTSRVNATITSTIADDLPDFTGDVDLLRRVLINLIGNSIKFTPADGHIVISAELHQGSGADAEPALLFSVRDDGHGIPDEDRDRIFEKWGQVEAHKTKRKSSTGLGLAFCKLAVEAHGGRIWVESQAGAGSTFSFIVPV